MASSSRSLSNCANDKCGKAIDVPRPGWSINDHKVDICSACLVAFTLRQFCDIYHKNEKHWSFCQYCDKKFHRNCIVSQNWYRKLETGGIICSICENREAMLIPNSKTTMDTSNPTPTLDAIVAPTSSEEDNESSDDPDYVGEEPDEQSSPRPLALEHYQNVTSYEAPARAQVQDFSRKSRGMKEKYLSKPRMEYQELNEITECSNVRVTPLFEKMLTASDTRKNGRLVVPKKSAEEYFPSCDDSEAKCILVQDSRGKDWFFNLKYWPNNNSRIYVLEGFYHYVDSKKLRAGDTVTFGRLNPEGNLVMGYRKYRASASSCSQVGSLQKDTTTSSSNKKGKMCMVTARTKRVASERRIIEEVEETRQLVESSNGANGPSFMVAEGFKIKSKKCMVTARTKRVESERKIIEEVEETRELVEPSSGTNVPSITVPEGFKIKSNKSMAKASTSSQGNVISATTPSMKKRGLGLIGKRVENGIISEEDITSEEDTELVRSTHRSKVPSVVVDKEVKIRSSKDMVSTKEVPKGKTTSIKHSTLSKGKSKDPISVLPGAKRKFSQIGTHSIFNLEKQNGPISVQSNDVKARDHVDGKRKSSEIGVSGKSDDNRNKGSEVDVTSKHTQELMCSPSSRNVEIKGSKGMVKTSTSPEDKTTLVTTQSMNKCGIGLICKRVKNETRKSEIDHIYEKSEKLVRSRHHSNVPSVMVNKEFESSKVSKGKTTSTKHSTFGKGKLEDPKSVQSGSKRKHSQTGTFSIFNDEKQKGLISVPSQNEEAEVVVDAKRKHNQIGMHSIFNDEKQKEPMRVQENEKAKVVVAKRKHNQIGMLSVSSEEKQNGPINVQENEKGKVIVDAKRKHNQIGTLRIFGQEKRHGLISDRSDNEKGKVVVDAKRKHNQISTRSIFSQEKQKGPLDVQSDYLNAKVPVNAKRKYSQIGTCSQEKQKGLASVHSDDVQAKVPIDARRKSCQIRTPLKSRLEKEKGRIDVDDGKAKILVSAKKKSFEIGSTSKSTKTQNKRSKVDLTSKHDQEPFFAPFDRNIEIKGSQDNAVVGLRSIFAKHARSKEESNGKTMKNGSSMMGQASSSKLQKGNVDQIKKRPSYRPIVCTQPTSGSNLKSSCKCHACVHFINNQYNFFRTKPLPTNLVIKPTEEGNSNLNHQMLISTQPTNVPEQVEEGNSNLNHQMLISTQPTNVLEQVEEGNSMLNHQMLISTQPTNVLEQVEEGNSNLNHQMLISIQPTNVPEQVEEGNSNLNHQMLIGTQPTNVREQFEEGNSNLNHQMLISTQPTNVPEQVEPLTLYSNHQMLVINQQENIQKPAEPEISNANEHTTVNGSSRDKQNVKILCDLNLPPEDEDEDDMWMIGLTYNGPF